MMLFVVVLVTLSCLTLLQPHGLGFSRQEFGVGCHFLLQGIFLTQGLNLSLLHWQTDSLPLSHLLLLLLSRFSRVQLCATP